MRGPGGGHVRHAFDASRLLRASSEKNRLFCSSLTTGRGKSIIIDQSWVQYYPSPCGSHSSLGSIRSHFLKKKISKSSLGQQLNLVSCHVVLMFKWVNEIP